MKEEIFCEACNGSGFCKCLDCLEFFKKSGKFTIACPDCKGRGTFDWIDIIHGRVPKSMVKELI